VKQQAESCVATVRDILTAVDRLAPFRLAETWDNVGLLLGDPARKVRRVLVSLDVTEGVCDEAERVGAEALLAHHPLIFTGLQRLTAETPTGRLVLRLAAAGRAVIAAHTNLDAAEGGLCDILAGMVGLEDTEPLQAAPGALCHKVVVFVPEADLGSVQAAAFGAGAGRIGDYTECGFSAEGTGTFLPGEGAEPAVGEKGGRNHVAERRFETRVEGRRLGAVLAAVAKVHPYEEPAIDVYPLHAPPAGAGLGRVGRLSDCRTLDQLADTVKEALRARAVHVAGDPETVVETVGVCTGSGGGLADAVAAAGCQAFVTGELKYHEVQDLAARGIGVILGGHYRTERVPLEVWAPRLAEALDVEVRMSESESRAIGVG
jgi:dinuclear metal center YbgI/SA1388 family protein